MCWGTGVGAVWAQEGLRQMCWSFCTPPTGSAPALPAGSTSLSEWRVSLRSPWQHVQAEKRTASFLCGETTTYFPTFTAYFNVLLCFCCSIFVIWYRNNLLHQCSALSSAAVLCHYDCTVIRPQAKTHWSQNKALKVRVLLKFWPPLLNYCRLHPDITILKWDSICPSASLRHQLV